jgi:hypothetical protein
MPSVIMPSVIMPNVIMLNVIMPNVIMPDVIMPNVIMPSVIMPNAIMPSVIMRNVVAPDQQESKNWSFNYKTFYYRHSHLAVVSYRVGRFFVIISGTHLSGAPLMLHTEIIPLDLPEKKMGKV